jgi:excisionase family DNA binding protein
MAKMFYTTEEAAQKIGVSSDQLKQLVSENKLREFRDGARVMFKVDQVDKLASDRKGGSSSGTKGGSAIGLADSGLSLAPADSHASDVISLSDSISGGAKDDTVVTGGTKSGTKGGTKGQQVFKSGEAKLADTGAQTHIESAIDDQLSLDGTGTGSGSGLLDLTRESDDTSLGAELLDEIYPGGDAKGESGIGSASGIFVEQSPGGSAAGEGSGPSGLEHVASAPAAPAMVADFGEPRDRSSGFFGGLALGSVVIAAATLVIGLCFYSGFQPTWLAPITGSTMYVLLFGVALLVVSFITGLIGMVIGRPA